MPLDAAQIEQAASLLAAAWKNRVPVDGLPDECMPVTLEDGYRIQQRLIALVDETISGWKLGVTSQAAMQRCNLTAPIIGRLWELTTVPEGTRVALDSFLSPTVEVELALDLARTWPAVLMSHGPLRKQPAQFKAPICLLNWRTATMPSLKP